MIVLLESHLDVVETWFLLAVEEMNDHEWCMYTKKWLLSMDLYENNCLLILDKVTFEMFSHFLVTKKRKVEKTCLFKLMMGVAVH